MFAVDGVEGICKLNVSLSRAQCGNSKGICLPSDRLCRIYTPEGEMPQSALYTDRLMSDRSTTLFRAVYSRELALEEYAQLVEEVLDPDMAFFLKNSYRSLSFTDGGD